ncbi:Hypothetical protein NTJ_09200 [Nesidiocoris tenuis]|nr:Hypothetical protein NTJ_09200 [Nesidiocoris tenuis]
MECSKTISTCESIFPTNLKIVLVSWLIQVTIEPLAEWHGIGEHIVEICQYNLFRAAQFGILVPYVIYVNLAGLMFKEMSECLASSTKSVATLLLIHGKLVYSVDKLSKYYGIQVLTVLCMLMHVTLGTIFKCLDIVEFNWASVLLCLNAGSHAYLIHTLISTCDRAQNKVRNSNFE